MAYPHCRIHWRPSTIKINAAALSVLIQRALKYTWHNNNQNTNKQEVPPGKSFGVTGNKEGGRLFIMWFFTPYEY